MEDKTSILMSDKSELETQLEEAEEDMAGLERKLRNVIAEVGALYWLALNIIYCPNKIIVHKRSFVYYYEEFFLI